MKSVAIFIGNCKGGTAKSTLIALLAYNLSQLEKTVLVVDGDSQGDGSILCRSVGGRSNGFAKYFKNPACDVNALIEDTVSDNLYVLTGGQETRQSIIDAIGNKTDVKAVLNQLLYLGYDYVIYDTPSEGVFQDAAMSIADLALLATEVGQLAITGAMIADATIKSRNPNAKTQFVPTKLHLNRSTNPAEVGNYLSFVKTLGLDRVSLPLLYRDSVLNMANSDVHVLDSDVKSTTPIKQMVKSLADWVLNGGQDTVEVMNCKRSMVRKIEGGN